MTGLTLMYAPFFFREALTFGKELLIFFLFVKQRAHVKIATCTSQHTSHCDLAFHSSETWYQGDTSSNLSQHILQILPQLRNHKIYINFYAFLTHCSLICPPTQSETWAPASIIFQFILLSYIENRDEKAKNMRSRSAKKHSLINYLLLEVTRAAWKFFLSFEMRCATKSASSRPEYDTAREFVPSAMLTNILYCWNGQHK